MDDVFALIQKHRANGLLIDTNLLVLLLVGAVNPNRIPQFKRTRRYSVDDFNTLLEVVTQFERRFATPQIWAEVSNLTDLWGDELIQVRNEMRLEMERAIEQYRPSHQLGKHSTFSRLGLTDASICQLSEAPMLVLTDDINLYIWLTTNGVDAVNFTHFLSANN